MAITVPIISEWNKTQLDKATKDIESFSSKSKKAFDGLASAGRKLTLGFAAVGVGPGRRQARHADTRCRADTKGC